MIQTSFHATCKFGIDQLFYLYFTTVRYGTGTSTVRYVLLSEAKKIRMQNYPEPLKNDTTVRYGTGNIRNFL